MNQDLERLVAYVRSLWSQEELPIAKSIDGNYDHMAATAAETVLQANLRYETHVAPRIGRIIANYPEAKTTSATLRILESIPATEFLNWRGEDRAERFVDLLKLFQANRIDTDADLKKLFEQEPGVFEEKLRAQSGIGPKTVDYLKILVGYQTSAINLHLQDFLQEAGIFFSDYDAAKSLINTAADRMNIPPAIFYHSIWHYMKDKRVKSEVPKSSQRPARQKKIPDVVQKMSSRFKS